MGNIRILRKRLQRKIGAAISAYGLIEPGDTVLLGVSGGKDSLALLDLLAERMRRSQGRWNLKAVHVDLENVGYNVNMDYLHEFAKGHGVELTILSGRLEEDRNKKRPTCFLCSWTRRKMMFDFAQKNGCTKIALGHHKDDIVKTALMNLTFAGSFSTMPAKLRMRKFPVSIIRPLCLVEEKDLIEWNEMNAYKKLKTQCPYDSKSSRTDISAACKTLESLSPEWKQSIFHALEKDGKLIQED